MIIEESQLLLLNILIVVCLWGITMDYMIQHKYINKRKHEKQDSFSKLIDSVMLLLNIGVILVLTLDLCLLFDLVLIPMLIVVIGIQFIIYAFMLL